MQPWVARKLNRSAVTPEMSGRPSSFPYTASDVTCRRGVSFSDGNTLNPDHSHSRYVLHLHDSRFPRFNERHQGGKALFLKYGHSLRISNARQNARLHPD